VIAVVLSHANLGVPGGYVGVDVFFVISGFLITRLLLQEADKRGRFSFGAFYARRARRIVPAATVVTIATLIGTYLWAPPLRVGAFARDGLAAALFSVNWRLAAQGTDYFQASAPPSPFQHFWSLSVEEQFYVCWPLLLAAVLLAVRNRDRRTRSIALITVLVVVIAASLIASIRVTHESAPYGYFGTHTRVWELAVGALIAATADSLCRLPRRVAAVMAWLGVAAIVTSCFVFDAGTVYPGSAAVLPVAGAGLIITAGCGVVTRFGPEGLLTLWPMRWTGRISYSLYLWHWPLLILLPDAVGQPLTIPQRLATIAMAVALSVASYFLVEQPFQHSRSLGTRPSRALAAGLGLVAASVIAALVVPSLVTIPGGTAVATPPPPLASPSAPASAPASSPASSPIVTSPPIDPALAAAQLKTAIADATTLTELPDTVAPPLVSASSNYPNSGGCEVNDSATAPDLPCDSFGDPLGDQQVVLIGDSHAGMWLSAVNSIAASEHWKLAFYAKSGCPLGDYPDFVNPSLKRTYTECNAWRPTVISDVLALHPSLIIIGSQERQIADSEPDGFEESVKALAAGGAKVVFLADTPSPAIIGSIPDCLSEHPSEVGQCAIPRAESALTSVARQTEISGARRAGASVIDPTPWFCTATICPAVVANTIVYEDNSHITATYGLLLAPELRTAIISVL
jgi:peptidoglycan/LPS O-acetylase OafA/YrhL